MKICLKILFFFALVFFLKTNAQSIEQLETKVFDIKKQIEILQTRIDSLELLLVENNRKIPKIKKSETLLKETLAYSAEISEEIKIYTVFFSELKNKFKNARNILYKKITNQLNNLKQAQNQNKIVELTKKQIIYAPLISALKYNPENLLNFQTSEIEDTLSLDLFRETLTGAIDEVENYLEKLKEIQNEYTEISELNKMANEFAEEIEFDSDISVFRASSNDDRSGEIEMTGSAKLKDKSELYTDMVAANIKNYNSILSQLNIEEMRLQDQNFFPKPLKNLSFTSYFLYLNNVKTVLIRYKKILIGKWQSVND